MYEILFFCLSSFPRCFCRILNKPVKAATATTIFSFSFSYWSIYLLLLIDVRRSRPAILQLTSHHNFFWVENEKKILVLSFSLFLRGLMRSPAVKIFFSAWFVWIEILPILSLSLCLFSLCSSSSFIIHTFALKENISHNHINTIMSAKIFLRRLTDMSTFNTLQDKLTRLNDTYLVSLKYTTYTSSIDSSILYVYLYWIYSF